MESERIPSRSIWKKAAIAAFFGFSAMIVLLWNPPLDPYVRGGERMLYVTAFHTLYGDFSGGVFRFSKGDFTKNLVLDHENLGKYRYSDIPSNFFAQSVTSVDWGLLIAWGKPWTQYGSGAIYSVDEKGKSSTYMPSEDLRFRNFATGSIDGQTVFASITHGSWFVQTKNLATGESRIFKIPYVPTVDVWWPNYITMHHFIDFADLDGDGNDEAYFTSTTPYAWVKGSKGRYAEGTVFSLKFHGKKKPELKNLGIPLPAFPRRLKTVRTESGTGVVVIYEGMLNGEGKTVLPVRIYRYRADPSGSVVPEKVAELSGHSECKTITQSDFLGYQTVQIGCDDAALYFFKDSDGKFELVKTLRFAEREMTDEYARKRSWMDPWSLYAVHAVAFDDVDGDGKKDMVVWVNNDGIYLVNGRKTDDLTAKISFGFLGWERVLDRDESFVISDGTFHSPRAIRKGSPYFQQ